MWGVGRGVWGVGFLFFGAGCRVSCFVLRVSCFLCGSWSRVPGYGFRRGSALFHALVTIPQVKRVPIVALIEVEALVLSAREERSDGVVAALGDEG